MVGRLQAQWAGMTLAVLIGWLPPTPQLRAADTEMRDFLVSVDNKKAGEYHMTIQAQDDGTVTMTAKADVKISYLVYKYTYTYRGTEVWKDNRLVSLESSTNDDGKQYTVSGTAGAGGFRLKANRTERTTRPDIWLSTYWRLPDPQFANKNVPLVDCDTGKDLSAKLEYVGKTEVSILGQKQPYTHYKVTGDVSVHVWYDGAGRMVRQEAVEDGHKTVLELANIRR